MEGIPSRRKFDNVDIAGLNFMLKESPVDVKERLEMVSTFLHNMGYSANPRDINDLSSSVNKLSLEEWGQILRKNCTRKLVTYLARFWWTTFELLIG